MTSFTNCPHLKSNQPKGGKGGRFPAREKKRAAPKAPRLRSKRVAGKKPQANCQLPSPYQSSKLLGSNSASPCLTQSVRFHCPRTCLRRLSTPRNLLFPSVWLQAMFKRSVCRQKRATVTMMPRLRPHAMARATLTPCGGHGGTRAAVAAWCLALTERCCTPLERTVW